MTEFNIRADKSIEKRGRVEKTLLKIVSLAAEYNARKEKLTASNNFNQDWEYKFENLQQKLSELQSKSSTLKDSILDMKSESYDMNNNKQTEDPAILKKLVIGIRDHTQSIEDFEKSVNTLQNEIQLLFKVMDKKLEGTQSTEPAGVRIEKTKQELGAAHEKLGKLTIQLAEIEISLQSINSDPNIKGDQRKALVLHF